MPTIENSVTINAPLDRVYVIAKDVERFPEFMPDVKELTVLEREGNRVVTRWAGVIQQFKVTVRWTEEDVWDDTAHTCTFRQLEGDYDLLEGTWTFTEVPEGTLFRSEVTYEYHVPLLGPLVARVVKHLVSTNIQNLLEAVKRRAEANG